MTFPKYGKIKTLYRRDMDTFKVIEGAFTRPEFELIPSWHITEKIDGTNVRVHYDSVSETIHFGGRTDRAQLQTTLYDRLQETFSPERFAKAFPDMGDRCVTLFGEGYGPGIQKAGKRYRVNVSFRLFDVLTQVEPGARGIWLQPHDVADVAEKLDIWEAPMLGRMSLDDALLLVRPGMLSTVAQRDPEGDPTLQAEGIVARAPYGVLDRLGRRIMWKMKVKDL